MSLEPKRLRGDAVANRAAIVAAAAKLWVRAGDAVPFGAVAREAGVGTGTLYRHFPDRAALSNAVIDQSYDDIASYAAEARDRPGDPLDAIAWFVERVVSSSPRLILPLLGNARSPGVAGGRHRDQERAIDDALGRLLERAIPSGAVRSDVRSTDIIVGAAAIASIRLPGDAAGRTSERLRRLLIDGIAGDGRRSALPMALSRDELTRAMPQRE